jgi:hypothetical protein
MSIEIANGGMIVHAPFERVDGVNDNVVHEIGWSRPPYIRIFYSLPHCSWKSRLSGPKQAPV